MLKVTRGRDSVSVPMSPYKKGKTMKRIRKFCCMILVLGLMVSAVSWGECNAETPGGEWRSSRAGWWYAWPDGTYPQNAWLNDNGKWYYFNEKGYMVTGWRLIDGKWYFFGSSGAMRTGWRQSDGKWYFFGNDGAMRTGWKLINSKWYYFNADGTMKTGWLDYRGKRYRLAASGEMLTGWFFNDHRDYYLDPDSGAMHIGWLKYEDKWYYFRTDGSMVTCIWSINGKVYYFDKEGAWIEDPVIPEHYDAEAAITFAREHIQNEIDQNLPAKKCTDDWLCAEFVSNCLEAGGVTAYSPSSTYLRGMLDACPLVTTHVAKLENGYLLKKNVKGEIAPGDVISIYCPYETDGLPYIHTILFAGWSSDGVALEYAHNSRVFNAAKRHTTCYACGRKLEEVYISHFTR